MSRPRINNTTPHGYFDVYKEMSWYMDKPLRDRSPIDQYNDTVKVPVQKLSLEGKLLAEYPSLAEAAREHGLSKTGVRDVINGKRKTAAGFKWRKKI